MATQKKQKKSLEPNLFMARLAEKAERYQDMFEFISKALEERTNPAHFT